MFGTSGSQRFDNRPYRLKTKKSACNALFNGDADLAGKDTN